MKTLDYYIQSKRFKKAGKFINPNSKLLDIGCNQCEFFSFLSNKGIYGIGIDPDPVQPLAAILRNVRFINSEFPSEKLDGEIFDTISALAVFEHIPAASHGKFTQSCNELLKPGGTITLTVPSPIVDYLLYLLKFLRLIDGMTPEQHHGYNPDDTTSIFMQAGFKLILHEKFEFGLNNLYVFEKHSNESIPSDSKN